MTAARTMYMKQAREILHAMQKRIKRREEVNIRGTQPDAHLISALQEQMTEHGYDLMRTVPIQGAPSCITFVPRITNE